MKAGEVDRSFLREPIYLERDIFRSKNRDRPTRRDILRIRRPFDQTMASLEPSCRALKETQPASVHP